MTAFVIQSFLVIKKKFLQKYSQKEPYVIKLVVKWAFAPNFVITVIFIDI